MSGPAKFWMLVILTVVSAVWVAPRVERALRGERAGPAVAREMGETPGVSLATAGPGHGAPPASTVAKPDGAFGLAEATVASGREALEPPGGTRAWTGGGLSVDAVAAAIMARRPALVIFFSPECPLSRRAMPEFVQLAARLRPEVQVAAFDASEGEAARVEAYLAQVGAGFRAEMIAPYPRGALSAALNGIGFRVGASWTLPLIAVVGQHGEVVGLWEGMTSLSAVERSLAASLLID